MIVMFRYKDKAMETELGHKRNVTIPIYCMTSMHLRQPSELLRVNSYFYDVQMFLGLHTRTLFVTKRM